MHLLTLGHGSLEQDALVSLARGAGVERIVDVRSSPGSRRFPWFGRDRMETWLPEAEIRYAWEPRLGGRRPEQPGSPHHALANPGLRAYADHMASEEFRAGVDAVRDFAADEIAALMCAEGDWRRCHRALLADWLCLITEDDVEHLAHDGAREPHEVRAEARLAGDRLVYDVGETPPLL